MKLALHHGCSDLSQLVRAGYKIPENVEFVDTEVGSRWLYPDTGDFSLEYLALRMTNIGQWRKTIGKLTPEDLDGMSDKEIRSRCGSDAQATAKLAPIILKEIDRTGLRKIWALAMSVLPVLAEMGGRGMALNKLQLMERARELGDWPDEKNGWLQKEKIDLQQLLGVDNLGSDIQVAQSLFGDRWKAEPLERTTRGYSVARRSLLWARHVARETNQQELVSLLSRLIVWTENDKLYSTYYKPWLVSGGLRVHSVYHLGGAASGRISSYDYNLQNVPGVARQIVVPSKGYDLIVSADYKMLEFCVAAHVSEDPTMLDLIKRGLDVHSLTAARVMQLPIPTTQQEFALFKVKYPDERATGKMSNFATIFGVGADSLHWQVFESTRGELFLSVEEAERYIDAFFSLFPRYQSYSEALWQKLRAGQWLCSNTGRRWLFEPNPAGWRKALNYPVQCHKIGTTVLTKDLRWTKVENLLLGDEVLAFDEEIPGKWQRRRWQTASVLGLEDGLENCYEISLESGKVFTVTAGHLHLVSYHSFMQWKRTEELTPQHKLIKVVTHTDLDTSWEGGYVSGMFDADGCLAKCGTQAHGQSWRLTVAQVANQALFEVWRILDKHEFKYSVRMNSKQQRKRWTPCYITEILGGRSEILRFLMLFRPPRLLAKFHSLFPTMGQLRTILHDGVKSVKFVGQQKIVRLRTSTSTYIAEGYATHNSLASDLVLLALKGIDDRLKKANMKSRMIGEIHDSIVFETKTKEVRVLVEIIKEVCENLDTSRFGFVLRVPLRIEITAGPTQGSLEDIKSY